MCKERENSSVNILFFPLLHHLSVCQRGDGGAHVNGPSVCCTYRAREAADTSHRRSFTENSQGAAITIHAESRRATGRGRSQGPAPTTRQKPPRTRHVRAAQGRPPAAQPRKEARTGRPGPNPRKSATVPPQGAPESGAREGAGKLSRVCFGGERPGRVRNRHSGRCRKGDGPPPPVAAVPNRRRRE